MDYRCKDHLGNEFSSKREMCEYWDIDYKTFLNRVNRFGWALDKALTAPVNNDGGFKKPCRDHLGNKFSSKKEMCEYWGIPYNLFTHRVNRYGWTLERALTTPVGCKDHLGNEFSTQKEMCKQWGIPYEVFRDRVNRLGLTLEEALTTPVGKIKGINCKDHLGNEFSSQKEMCKYWGVSYMTFRTRINDQGWSLEKALTTPVSKIICKDHLGNEFISQSEMCRYWNVPWSVVKKRVNNCGWSLERALTTPVRESSECKDHLGHEFSTKREMCKYWGISYSVFNARVNQCGWSLEKALTTPLGKRGK